VPFADGAKRHRARAEMEDGSEVGGVVDLLAWSPLSERLAVSFREPA
jgi:hypothetical protein